jgi:uncharacterized damage-inducible protein DinB
LKEDRMDVSSMEKMAMASRQMMVDFLKKYFAKTIAKETDSELVKNAKSRFHSILVHVYEGEYLYFYNPLTGSNEKPDISKLSTGDVEKVIGALSDPREKLYKFLATKADKPNEPIPGSDMTPNLVYFWLVEHDAWHHGQMELLVETIEKESLQPEIVFEDEP